MQENNPSIIYGCNWGQKQGRKVYSDHNTKQFWVMNLKSRYGCDFQKLL